MPAYRFTWDHFDDVTIRGIADVLGFVPGNGAEPKAYLSERVKRPTSELVSQCRDVLLRTWLPGYPGIKGLVETLQEAGVGPMTQPTSLKGYLDYIRNTRNTKTLRGVLANAMIRFGDADRTSDGEVEEEGTVRRFAILTVASQPRDERKPYRHQELAWEAMSAHLAEAEATKIFQGLIVMPTGSGKTFAAVRWLTENVLARKMRVLWLAHRHELLEQAAVEFYRQISRVRERERVRIRLVSGMHCRATQIDPADDVVIASVNSLARRPDIRDDILDDARTFLVVDEAHHAPAKSYRDLITALQERKRFRLLGLTATATRTAEVERPLLSKLFARRILFQIETKVLIEQGILSRPIPVRVPTSAEVEQGLTDNDLKHLEDFGELSEEWLERIATLSKRNKCIVGAYIQNKTKYGKTIVFAINVPHAALLAEHFRREGVRANYVASYRPDKTDGTGVLDAFRRGELDVLVNVQVLTEGVDIPDIRTAFLTRPTSSEILVRQMIGRALRGPAAGGTAEAYIVSFEDHWERFRDWASPFDLVPDVVGGTTVTSGPPIEKGDGSVPPPSLPPGPGVAPLELGELWEPIRRAAAHIAATSGPGKVAAYEAIPNGWYLLERTVDDQVVAQTIHVYEHQRPCWEALLSDVRRMPPDDLKKAADGNEFYAKYFNDCDVPAPSEYDVRVMLRHHAYLGDPVVYRLIEERKTCDPSEVARHIWDRDLGQKAQAELIESRYTRLARAVYPTLRDYHSAVDDVLYEIRHPDEATRRVRAIPIFDPGPTEQLAAGPKHDLVTVVETVLERGRLLLGIDGALPRPTEVTWTDHLVKGWYAMAYSETTTAPGHGRIRVNRLLDSPDVDVSVLEFLLWHEYLHLFLNTTAALIPKRHVAWFGGGNRDSVEATAPVRARRQDEN